MDFPREHCARIASPNPLGRVSRESDRGSDAIGIFPNVEAIVRFVYALVPETNDERTVARRYTSPDSVARVNGTTSVGLSAVAT